MRCFTTSNKDGDDPSFRLGGRISLVAQHIPINFLAASASDLPLGSSQFDKCFVSFGLHHMSRYERQKALVSIIMEDYRNANEARGQTSWGTDTAGKGIDFDTKYANLVVLYEGDDVIRPEAWMCGSHAGLVEH